MESPSRFTGIHKYHFLLQILQKPNTKRRPALVLSEKKNFGSIIEHTVLAMITSQKNEPWPLDIAIEGKNKRIQEVDWKTLR